MGVYIVKRKDNDMRFKKEYLIIFIIMLIVLLSNCFTNRQLSDSVEFIRNGIISIENKMKEKNEINAQKEFHEIKNKWKEKSENLALFVEHNELEKVSKEIVIIESNFETDDYDEVIENISELKFVLEHIEEKNKLKLKNIF